MVPKDAMRILDVGCANGWLANAIKDRQACTVYGIELDASASRFAATRMDRVFNDRVESVLNKLDGESFDCIVLADILEHLTDPWSVLRQLSDRLSPGGKIVASIPNVCNWTIVDQLIHGNWRYEAEGILDRTHLRFFTARSIHELFWNCGLTITEILRNRKVNTASERVARLLRKPAVAELPLSKEGDVFQYIVSAEKRSASVNSPKVVVVVLNWNGKDDTLECLRSLKTVDYNNLQIVVVDNGSSDDSVLVIRECFPDVVVIALQSNHGYAGGNNVGIRWALRAGAEWVLVLNNDTIVDPMIIRNLVSVGTTIPEAGVLGPKVYFYDDPNMIWHAGARSEGDYVKFVALGYGVMDDGTEFNQISETDYLYGCAFFVSKDAIAAVGLFDETFFLTHEDVDWCRRATRVGFKCIFVPQAKVWHKVSVSFGGAESALYNYFRMRGRLVWGRKYLRVGQRCRLWVNIAQEVFSDYFGSISRQGWYQYPRAKQCYWVLIRCLREFRINRSNLTARAKLCAIIDFCLGRFGFPENRAFSYGNRD